jgi:hypothetical protein
MLQQIFFETFARNGKLLGINPAAKSRLLELNSNLWKTIFFGCSREMLRNTPDSSFSHKLSSKLEDIETLLVLAGAFFCSENETNRENLFCHAIYMRPAQTATLFSSPSDDYAIQKVAKGASDAFLLPGKIEEECP